MLVRTKRGERTIPMLDGTDAVLSTTPIEVPDHYALDLCRDDDNLEIVDPNAHEPERKKAVRKDD